jgi:hypothetical protein
VWGEKGQDTAGEQVGQQMGQKCKDLSREKTGTLYLNSFWKCQIIFHCRVNVCVCLYLIEFLCVLKHFKDDFK